MPAQPSFRRRSVLAALVCALMITVVSIGGPSPAAADTLVPNLLKDVNPGVPGSTPNAWVQKGAEVFFLVNDGPDGLWKTDGTTAGTVLVKSLSIDNTPTMVLVGTTLFFGAGTFGPGGAGNELWKSDGTEAGTVLVKDIVPGSSSQPTDLIAVGSTLYFAATTPAEGKELWKSDGTEAGTVLVKDINTNVVPLPPPNVGTGPASSNPGTLAFSSAGGAKMIAYGGTLLFAATDGGTGGTGNGVELWKSDGTTAGTVMVKEINPDCESLPNNPSLNANPTNMVLLGGKVLFAATEGGFRCGPPIQGIGTELWATDGTAAGTVLVKDINVVNGTQASTPSGLTVLNATTVVFAAQNGINGIELWKTDGTEPGTVLVENINTTTATASSMPATATFTVAGGVAYFSASNGTTAGLNGSELWKTDGTPDGTVLVKDINPGTASSLPMSNSNAAAVGTDLYFSATHPAYGVELWKTDGTEAGTVLTRDVRPGSAGSTPTLLSSAIGMVFFSADDGTTGREPWVTRTNQAVVAANDTYFADQDTPLTVAAPGLLDNDVDPDGGILSAGSPSDPPQGSVTVNGDGSFTYTPDAGYVGTDTFTYTASDGQGGTAVATASITVLAPGTVAAVKGEACSYQVKVGLFGGGQGISGCGEIAGSTPRPPGPTPEPGSPTALDTSYSPHVRLPADGSGGTMTATDADGAEGRFGPAVIHGGKWPCEETDQNGDGTRNCLTGGPPSGPQAASTSGSPATGTVTSTADISLHPTPLPAPCYTGYGPTCFDVGGFGPFPVEGDSLHAECTATKTSVTGTATFSNAVLATSTDEFGTPVTSEPVPNNPPVNYTRHGVITNVGDVFSVVYNEQIHNADGSLTVNAVHMYLFGPVAVGEVIRGQVTCGTTPAPVPAPDTTAPTCGTAVVEPLGPEDPTPREPRTELVGVFDAGGLQSITNVQASNATVSVGRDASSPPYLRFTPGQVGPLPVTAVRNNPALPMFWSFDATDAAGNVTRCLGVLSPPVAVDDTYAGTAGSPLVVAAPGVLTNDTDANATDVLTAGSASTPTNGTVVLNADGSFTYTPGAGFTGACFTYVVSDGTGLTDTGAVRITSGGLPVACPDAYSTNEDTRLSVTAPGVLGNDVDPDGTPLNNDSFFVFTDAGGFAIMDGSGSFEYDPPADFGGTDTFSYDLSSGGDTVAGTVSITVNPVNDAPVAEDDTATTTEGSPVTVPAPGVLGNDTDVDSATLTAGSAGDPPGGSVTLNANGSYTYTPDADFAGTDTFTYTVSDGTLSDTGLVSITVTGTPDPTVAVDDAYTTNEDTPVTVAAPGVLGNDTDPDGPLTASGASDPANGSVTLNANGSFTYTPDANFSGTDTFVYTASDGTSSDIGQVTITVNAANDAPVAGDDTASTNEDTSVTVVAPGVLGNDTDADGDTMTAGSASNPPSGSVTLNANGSYTYTPDADFNGTDTFTYTVSDGNGGTDTGLVTITVNAVNDAPVAVDDSYTTSGGVPLTVAAPGVLANDTDVDNVTRTAGTASDPPGGSVTLAANGSFTYTPDAGFVGTDTFTYVVSDGAGGTDTGLVTITVTGSTFAPLSPARVWDSRFGPGPVGAVGPGQTRNVTVTGIGGVPATGVTAVVLNVTAVNPTAATFITAWPAGETKPLASNLNVPPGDVRPNLVIVKVGAGGQISFNNDAGNVDLIADVAGWYGPAGGQRYTSLSPSRVWDSRFGPGPVGAVGPGQTRNVTVTGIGGVPATGVTAVVLNVTAVNPTAATFITAWPAGETKPLASNLNVPPGDVRPNLVIVKVGAGGQISFNNDAGNVDLIADVAGYYGSTGSSFASVSPSRVWDSRFGPGPTGAVGPGQTRSVTVTGIGGVPATGVTAVVLNVTAVNPTAATFITAWPAGEAKPLASNLNVPPGDVRPNLVIVKVGAGGQISFNNDAGNVDLIADVAGWYGAPGA